MSVITIDSGTTNTRVRLWHAQQVVVTASEPVGLRDTAITGNNEALLAGVKNALDSVLTQADACQLGPCTIIASGMLTADNGLCPLPHLIAPVGLDDLAKAACCCTIPALTEHPIWFIPGVKNAPADALDAMRGEEVEAFGLLSVAGVAGPALFVLPGSHSKFIRIDEQQRIAASCTTLAGELLDVLTKQTLLTPSLGGQFASDLHLPFLLKGAAASRSQGFARSCFCVRLLDLFTEASQSQRASYLLGAVLASDIQAIRQSPALRLTPDIPIFISGKAPLRQALAALIAADPFFTTEAILPDEDRPLSGLGALAIAARLARTDASR